MIKRKKTKILKMEIKMCYFCPYFRCSNENTRMDSKIYKLPHGYCKKTETIVKNFCNILKNCPLEDYNEGGKK